MPRTVLVVDDNDVNRRMLRKILEGQYQVLEAADGEQALALLRREPAGVSAVLLDLLMPVMDGYTVLERMRADPALSQTPVIVATGNTESNAELRALSLGANDFVTKPYSPAIILQRLHNIVTLRETSALVNTMTRDQLTGLYSREAFFLRAGERIAAREPGYYVIACFDVNSFKVINDQYGSEKGDQVLRLLAEVFERGFAQVDGLCCRVMADNFAALYPYSFMNTAELDEIRRRAMELDGSIPPLSFGVGRYRVEDLSLSVSAMYDRAVMALETIKGRYDKHVALYDESMREHLLREQEIISEMNGALAGGQFEMWLQPQYNHSSGALIGAEALVRWRHPQKGLIPPNSFIPVFERNGFIYELDKHMWETACKLLRRWLNEGRSPLPISVNISRYDVFREDMVAVLVGLIRRYDIPVELLRLEITESAFARSAGQIIRVVERLLDGGFTVEIDDFGSGYSSLNTLKDVPANVLKLDMRFLEGGGHSSRGGNILESIVRMAKWLGMSVIAEGVETKEQADYLRSIGCVYVQGYLYARPMPVPEYEALAYGLRKEEKLLAMEAVETLDNETFWNPTSLETLIFNSYVGSACVFEYAAGRVDVLRANRAYAEVLCGKAAPIEEALRVVWVDHMDEAGREENRRLLQEAIRTGKEVVGEAVFRDLAPSRKRAHLRFAMRVIARTENRALFYCRVDDLTEQREAEQQLRAHAERIRSLNQSLASLMNDTPGGFVRFRVHENGALEPIYLNEGFCKLVNLSQAEVLAHAGADAMRALHPEDIASVRAVVQDMLARGGTRSVEYRQRHGDGGYVRVRVVGRAIREEDGATYLNAYYTDLSEEG